MDADKVLALAKQAGFAVYDVGAYAPQPRSLVQGDSENAIRFYALLQQQMIADEL